MQLLLGIKDTDDNLVASTLICLSELVPILGGDTVIGAKRSKLFTDGRPNSKTNILLPQADNIQDCRYLPQKPLRNFHCSQDIYQHNIIEPVFDKSLTLNERPSPVGGESIDDEVILTKSNAINTVNSEDDWSDWDNSNRQIPTIPQVQDASDIINSEQIIKIEPETTSLSKSTTSVNGSDKTVSRTSLLQKAALEAKKNIVDISELDIKNQKIDHSKKSGDEFDFFADMMPIIEKPAVVNVTEVVVACDVSSKLNFIPDEGLDENEGWGENWND